MELTGRRAEVAELKTWYDSDRPEFAAVYGRRRVGKTCLIKTTLSDHFAFYFTGVPNAGLANQLENFAEALREFSGRVHPVPKDWFAAFRLLKAHLQDRRQAGKKVVFIDELPWLDTHKSGFVPALDWFWNSWASTQPDILLIVCGSAANWMIHKLFGDRGGLHNRVTRRLLLQPFSLADCADYYTSQGIVMNRTDALEAYMILGGIPYYLSLLDRRYSLAQNVGRLCFDASGALRREFDNLYASLFRHSERHVAVVTALATKNKGLTRDELIRHTRLASGGGLSQTLDELEESGFIRQYRPFSRNNRGSLYQLVDAYTSFYFNFIRSGPADDRDFWLKYHAGSGHAAWSGNAFERVCQAHLHQIQAALGISGVITSVSSWRSQSVSPGAQVDLVLDRADNVVNLCEVKFAREEYAITKSVDEALRRKRAAFIAETGTTKAVHTTLITTYGITRNAYAANVQSEITAEDLFRPA